MAAILALDQGTTSSRAIVFDEAGLPVATAQREFTQHYPAPGWVEHDPTEIWHSQRDVAAAAIESWRRGRGNSNANIDAIGITNQRETTVLWNRRTGQPIAPAIVWQDRRTALHCQQLIRDGHEETIRAKTGLVVDPYFSATKIVWLLQHTPGARECAERGELAFGTIDCWLLYNLTAGKVHATDVSNASRTMLFNIHTLDWDDALLDLLGVPRAILPKIVSSSEVIGETSCDGLPAGIPIASLVGDQQAALFGQGCHRPGLVKNTYGTGCFMLMNTGNKPSPSPSGLISTVAWRLSSNVAEAVFALEGSVFIAGAAVQWLRDGLGIIDSAAEVEALAASVPTSDGVVFVPAFSGLGTPDWDPTARGMILGLTRGTNRGHIARASLEAIAFQCADLLFAMRAASHIEPAELWVDGGGTANQLLMQLQADILGIPVVKAHVPETTALGAAYLAGLAIGVWASTDDLGRRITARQRWEPRMSRDQANATLANWRRAIPRAKGWAQ